MGKKRFHNRILRLATLCLVVSLTAGCGISTTDGGSITHQIAEAFGLNEAAEQMDSEESGTIGTADSSTDNSSGSSAGSSDTADSSSSSDSSDSETGSTWLSILPDELDVRYQDSLPTGDSLFVNNATIFYYYTTLTDTQKQIYDALLAVVQDPVAEKYRKRVELTESPESDEFKTDINYAYKALIADHPELFWLAQNGSAFSYYYTGQADSDGTYVVMIQLAVTYDNYEKEMTDFNNAVDAFMADIDLTQSQPMIALQIHDKLIDLVTYDDELADTTEASGSVTDYGYTAYGALCVNSRGEANTAVCDGYSYAFEYLCQQAGLTVTRITGKAGSSMDSLGGHSWNLIQYDDGQWYEVDATWDDQEPDISEDDQYYYIYEAAMSDTQYWNRIRHYLFNVTTDTISNFVPDDSYTYYMADGSYATFLGSSYHIRDDGSDSSTGDVLTSRAPVAEGTQYSYDNLMGY
ncbi:MAG: hypothetical protein SOI56_01720 [Eubacteriales bacterium]